GRQSLEPTAQKIGDLIEGEESREVDGQIDGTFRLFRVQEGFGQEPAELLAAQLGDIEGDPLWAVAGPGTVDLGHEAIPAESLEAGVDRPVLDVRDPIEVLLLDEAA